MIVIVPNLTTDSQKTKRHAMQLRIRSFSLNNVLIHIIFIFYSTMVSSQEIVNKEYKFGVADQIQIRVFDLRSSTGEAYQWPAYNSEYTIDSAGRISLPLIGSIDAQGLTSIELQKKISAQLQAKVGLAQQPSTTVQVIKYRPFYIVGSVQNPGEYEYRPGLTMIQAVSISGGLEKLSGPDKYTFDRNSINLRGDLKRLKFELLALTIRSARLSAEISGSVDFSVESKQLNDFSSPEVANLIQEEKSLLKNRQDSNRSQLANLNSTIETLKEQIKSLEGKDLTQQRQLELSKQEAAQLNDLLSKGLVSTTRRIGAEQAVAGIENNKMDIYISKLKSQQDLKNAQKEIIDLRDKQKIDAIRENTELKSKIIDLNTKIETNNRLLERDGDIISNDIYSRVTYRVKGMISNRTQSFISTDGDPVSPGDVIIVELLRPGQ